MTCKACTGDILLAMRARDLGIEIQELYYTGVKAWPWILRFVWNEKKPIAQEGTDLNVEL